MTEQMSLFYEPPDGKRKNVLVACEESQAVCKAFRELGHRAFSCDLQPCSGGHPEWHILGDCLPLIDGNCDFVTMDGKSHRQDGEWDILVAHPPCTYLTVTGNAWFSVERYGNRAIERARLREEAAEFFMQFVNAKCRRVAVENPIGYMSTHFRKPDQIIQPWQFGHEARKATCLWLNGLPTLMPTNIVSMGEIKDGGYSVGASANYARDENGKILLWSDPRTAIIRSRTFEGIARAMAEQWGGVVNE